MQGAQQPPLHRGRPQTSHPHQPRDDEDRERAPGAE